MTRYNDLLADFVKHKRRTMTVHDRQQELSRITLRALKKERFVDMTHISTENARWDTHSSANDIRRLQRLNAKRNKEKTA